MRQVGWWSASSTVAWRDPLGGPFAEGTARAGEDQPAQAAVPTGDALQHRAVLRVHRDQLATAGARPPGATRSPAMTSVSLLASATRLPARSAASVASSPAAPTTALTHDVHVGAGGRLDQHAGPWAAASPCSGQAGEGRLATRRPARRARPGCGPPVSATTRKWSRWRRSTSSVLRPIEPVEPRIATPAALHQITPKARYSIAATGITK